MLYTAMKYSFKDIVLTRNSGNKKTKNFFMRISHQCYGGQRTCHAKKIIYNYKGTA